MRPANEESDLEEVTSVEDEKFDLVYPPKIRELSSIFWTPVRIAAEAARLLVPLSATRVLDIGCGPGKFCLVGASLTHGLFTGVEQRGDLVDTARKAAHDLHLAEVTFLHANITDVSFDEYDTFYIFNPFEENMSKGYKIDASVELSPALFKHYAAHVATQLGAQPIGTRVVTYMGYADEIPSCYSCELAVFGEDLKLWVKTSDYDPDAEHLGPPRSYRGSAGWASPRGR